MGGVTEMCADPGAGADIDGAVSWAERFLAERLDARLRYHHLAHTRDEVVPIARDLARAEGLAEHLDAITLGAWFHDIGHVIQAREHEAIGAGIASAVLPGFGVGDDQVAAVRATIMATRIPQAPTTLAGRVVADADLAVLGADNFRERNDDLRVEMAGAGSSASLPEWYRGQIAFVEAHTYFTDSARERWDEPKQENLAWLRRQAAAHR